LIKDERNANITLRIKRISSYNSAKEVKQLSFLVADIISVDLGFAYGYVKRLERE